MSASEVWDGLSLPWKTVLAEAWESFRDENFGIGAALVDPADDSIVTVGRNRVAQTEPEIRTLSGNMAAHAEMNAFAALDRFNAEGLHLYTTLEPCLMCIGTAMQLKVAHIHFALRDEFFEGMDQLWAGHPVTADRYPPHTGPLPGRLGQMARFLPLVFNFDHFPDRRAAALAQTQHPELARLAKDFLAGDLGELRSLPTFTDAFAQLWDRLPTS